MFIYLTTNSPQNTKFITESGQVLYKSETPLKGAGKSTIVTKVVPNDAPRPPGANIGVTQVQKDGEGEHDEDVWVEEVDEPDMQDRYRYLGSIKWNLFTPSIFVFPGDEKLTVKKFFTTGVGFSAFGRNKMWTATNGRQYKWKPCTWTSSLVLNDSSDTLVVKYHRKRYGLYKKKGQPILEIFEGTGGDQVLDQIILTFIYVETVRKRRERAARH